VDEPALIASARHGDLEAFNRLVLQYQSMVFNLAYRMMGEADSASDAAQETFISAWRHLGAYRGGSFKAWLLRIATNACYDELRRRKRRPAASLEALTVEDPAPEAEAGADLKAATETPEAFAQRRELARALQNCLNHLPDDMRLVAVMSDVQGFDYAEIAETLGIPDGKHQTVTESLVQPPRLPSSEQIRSQKELHAEAGTPGRLAETTG
jgi:RNA polymerase sigma-70 factor (ECF subfamily)